MVFQALKLTPGSLPTLPINYLLLSLIKYTIINLIKLPNTDLMSTIKLINTKSDYLSILDKMSKVYKIIYIYWSHTAQLGCRLYKWVVFYTCTPLDTLFNKMSKLVRNSRYISQAPATLDSQGVENDGDMITPVSQDRSLMVKGWRSDGSQQYISYQTLKNEQHQAPGQRSCRAREDKGIPRGREGSSFTMSLLGVKIITSPTHGGYLGRGV